MLGIRWFICTLLICLVLFIGGQRSNQTGQSIYPMKYEKNTTLPKYAVHDIVTYLLRMIHLTMWMHNPSYVNQPQKVSNFVSIYSELGIVWDITCVILVRKHHTMPLPDYGSPDPENIMLRVGIIYIIGNKGCYIERDKYYLNAVWNRQARG